MTTDDDKARALAGLRRMHVLEDQNQNGEHIYEGRLTETEWLTAHAALQSEKPVDVEALKKKIPRLKGDRKETTAMVDTARYAFGWNDCIDHLKAKGYLK